MVEVLVFCKKYKILFFEFRAIGGNLRQVFIDLQNEYC
jgi:hypothetical protein